MKPLIVLGGGGHAKVVIDLARSAGFSVIGFLDANASVQSIGSVRRLGGDDLALSLRSQGVDRAFVAIGENSKRRAIGCWLIDNGFTLPTLVHPSAVISNSASIGIGTAVMAHAAVNAAAVVGEHSIVNTGAIIEHDCVLATGVHVAPRSVLGGGCNLGEEVLFGIGACARPRTKIGDKSVIGAGSVVIADILAHTTAFGTPARAR